MSSDARPISSAQFALALENLPVENLYAKVFEIRNAIAHLMRSNKELEEYSASEGPDPDFTAAVRENEKVAELMKERVGLIRKEVEQRGQRWHETEEEQANVNVQPKGEVAAAGGRLEDEAPSGQLNKRMAGHNEEVDQAEAGVHL